MIVQCPKCKYEYDKLHDHQVAYCSGLAKGNIRHVLKEMKPIKEKASK